MSVKLDLCEFCNLPRATTGNQTKILIIPRPKPIQKSEDESLFKLIFMGFIMLTI